MKIVGAFFKGIGIIITLYCLALVVIQAFVK